MFDLTDLDSRTADDAVLAITHAPLALGIAAFTAAWRVQRNKSLRDMGLPPMREQGDRK